MKYYNFRVSLTYKQVYNLVKDIICKYGKREFTKKNGLLKTKVAVQESVEAQYIANKGWCGAESYGNEDPTVDKIAEEIMKKYFSELKQ